MLCRSAKEKEIGRLAGSASSAVSDGEFKRHTDALESQARPPPLCAAAPALHIRMRCTHTSAAAVCTAPPALPQAGVFRKEKEDFVREAHDLR
jgi:hypothetical protein